MVYVHALAKGLKRALQHLMRIFSACRKRNASRGRRRWNFRDIISTGTMPTDGDIPELLFLQRKSHCLWRMELELRNMTKKGV